MTPSDLFQVTRTMDRLIDEFMSGGGSALPLRGEDGGPPSHTLPVDILETEEAYLLTAPVPGFAPEAVEVTFDQGVLTITAQAEPRPVEGTWLRQERPHGSWTRRLQLPEQVDGAGIAADFDNGLLTVTVPKAAKPQPVKIPVNGGPAARALTQ